MIDTQMKFRLYKFCNWLFPHCYWRILSLLLVVICSVLFAFLLTVYYIWQLSCYLPFSLLFLSKWEVVVVIRFIAVIFVPVIPLYVVKNLFESVVCFKVDHLVL